MLGVTIITFELVGDDGFSIGQEPISVDVSKVKDRSFNLTVALKELLTKNNPDIVCNEDILNFKKILTLTDEHCARSREHDGTRQNHERRKGASAAQMYVQVTIFLLTSFT